MGEMMGALAMLFVVIAGLLFVLWLLMQDRITGWRRQRLRSKPFPDAWRAILKQRVPYVRALPADLQLQLKKHIQVFLAEKAFIGCGGLVITDEIRVTIAAQACLLILNRETDYYPRLRQILVYPNAFVVRHSAIDEAGVHQDQREVRLGESWAEGQVILSWDDAVAGAAVVDDAQNVVIHEFAHQLDTEKGYANGAPVLGGRQRHERWSRVMWHEFDKLQDHARWGEPSLFDHYGATDPAEFFAVVCETFFERPREMSEQHAELYRELCEFFRIDPLTW